MSHRMTSLAIVVLVALGAPALAQTPNPQAEALNDEGKALYKSQDWNGAAGKFRQAISIAPDARYYFNLCATLEKAGDYDGALEACDAVYANDPKDDLKAKTGQRAAEIRQKKRARDAANPPPPDGGGGGGTTGGGGGDPTGGGGGDPTGGGGGDVSNPYGGGGGTTGGGGGGGTVMREPPPGGGGGDASVEAQADPRDKYKWSLGIDLGFASNQGVGNDLFGDSGQAIRLHADILFAPKRKIGAQFYANIYSFEQRSDTFSDEQLSIVDLGAAVFWHKRLARGFYLTPLAGVHVTSLQPYRDVEEAYGTIGVRADVALNWVLGGGRHVFTLVPLSLNLYAPTAANVGGLDAEAFGFDEGGATYAFTLGYTFRFTSDILPGLIVLE